MPSLKGRNVRVEVAASYRTPVAVASVSNALPAFVTAIGHGLAEGVAGYFTGVAGMVPLEGQAAIVCQPETSDSFAANGLNTISYPAGGASQFVPVSSWLTLAECTSYQLNSADAAPRNVTTILDRQARSKPGLFGAQTLTLNLIPLTMTSNAMVLLQSAALARASVLIRITHVVDNALRVCRGHPSYPSEGVNVGALGSSTLALAVDGMFLFVSGITPPPPPPPGPPPSVGDYTTGDYFAEDYTA